MTLVFIGAALCTLAVGFAVAWRIVDSSMDEPWAEKSEVRNHDEAFLSEKSQEMK